MAARNDAPAVRRFQAAAGFLGVVDSPFQGVLRSFLLID